MVSRSGEAEVHEAVATGTMIDVTHTVARESNDDHHLRRFSAFFLARSLYKSDQVVILHRVRKLYELIVDHTLTYIRTQNE